MSTPTIIILIVIALVVIIAVAGRGGGPRVTQITRTKVRTNDGEDSQ